MAVDGLILAALTGLVLVCASVLLVGRGDDGDEYAEEYDDNAE